MKRTRWLIFAFFLVLALYPFGGVLANKPDTYIYEYSVVGEWIADCDGFNVLADSDQKLVERFFYDNDGNVKKIQYHWSATNGIVYNSEHPERWLPEGPDHIMYYVTPNSPYLTQAGLALHVTVPGYGIIGINAGRIILLADGPISEWEVIWEKGQNDFFNQELDALCEYLATP